MIVGCYTLDLYCDDETCKPKFKEFPKNFIAEYGSECRAQARRAGWKLNLRDGTAICPRCSGSESKEAAQEKKRQ